MHNWSMSPPSPHRRRKPARIVALAAAAIGALWACGELYVRWPSTVAPPPVALQPGVRHVVLVVHGSFGREEPTLVELEARLRELLASRPAVQITRYGWSPWSDNILRAGSHGSRIGTLLGQQLAAAWQAEATTGSSAVTLHLIAHSAGAYLLDPLCERLRQDLAGTRARIFIRMTFLDPIGLRGLLQRGWGAGRFGRCADSADAWINTDDSAPATDRWLRHAWNIDVTRAAGRDSFAGDGHRWPVQYYLQQLSARDLDLATSRSVHPPGGVERR